MWGLLAIPLVAVLYLLSQYRIKRNRAKVADQARQQFVFGTSSRLWQAAHPLLILLAIGSGVIAIARPQTDPREVEVESFGRDIVIMVDVSRSMLARDVVPSRLEKAKLWMNDLVDDLGNDRVGLVAFAGSSSVLSPLTTDRLFFRLAIEELGPSSVPLGGTNIGDTIRKTVNLVFPVVTSDESRHRDIILISDGEDQESLPVEAARAAGKQGIRIICIGIGSSKGAPVPLKDSSSAASGKEVRSKLESQTLREIASASPGGVYLEVGTGNVDLAKVYHDLIESADQHMIETNTTTQYTERFMYFIGLSAICIFLETTLLPSPRRKVLV
ncbi:MAG: vWA domain-containing protein [Phycisphaerales bacterium]